MTAIVGCISEDEEKKVWERFASNASGEPPTAQHWQDQGVGGEHPTEQEAPYPFYHPGKGDGDGGLVQVAMTAPKQ